MYLFQLVLKVNLSIVKLLDHIVRVTSYHGNHNIPINQALNS